MFERLAFYGVVMVRGIYVVTAVERGGLGLTHMQRALIFAVWALIQCLLPMFTGAFSDRYGYKRSLFIAYTINVCGYFLMGLANTYEVFFIAAIMVGTGTAIFKPPLHGSIAHCVSEKNSSVGWGIFYQLVNIGGFLGPFVAGLMRKMDWSYVFFASAAFTALNFIPTIFFLKDFSKEVRKDKKDLKNPFATFLDGISTLFKDMKFVMFLLIFSGFWLMFMQLWDTMPIFVDEWVDSSTIIAFLSSLGIKGVADTYGNVPPEWMINIDAFSIIVLMIFIGYITGHFKPIVMMIVGMLISLFGLIFTGANTTGWLVLLGIFVFAIGEMTCSPKFSEYIGLMAPPEKKAIYLGYSNIPFAIGWFFALLFSGVFYGNYADKYDFGRQYLANELGVKEIYVQYIGVQETPELEGTYATGIALSETDTVLIPNPEARLPEGNINRIWVEKETVIRDRALEKQYHKQGKALIKQGNIDEGQKLLTKETGLKRIAVMPVLTYKLEKTNREITAMLWDKYHPWKMWVYFGFIGAGAILLMIGYHFYLEREMKKVSRVS
jgi:MFS family permease